MRASCCAPCPSVVPRPSATASPPTAGRAVSHSSRHGSRRPRRRAWTVISSAIGEWGRRRGVPWHAPERQRSPTSAFIRRRGPSSSRAQRAALRKRVGLWSSGVAARAGCDQRALWPCSRTAPAPPARSIACVAASPRAPCRRWRPRVAAAARAARAGRSSTARRAAGIRASAPHGVPRAARRRHAGRRRTG